ncbi:MAG: hypothetical protein ACJ8GN_10940 [Longimicrobiaceae bacterium]
MSEQTPGATPNPDHRQAIYLQLCDSDHKIDEFRAKLLALLPFASAAGLFLLLNDKLPNRAAMQAAGPFFVPIGIFGVVVTLGLFAYEIYGIQKCGELIGTGILLETDMQVRGQFTSRPNRVINEVFAAGVIYPAVLAGWLFLTLFTLRENVLDIAELVFFTGFAGMLAWDVYLVREAERHRRAREADEKARAVSPGT